MSKKPIQKIYMASRFGRREEVQRLSKDLEKRKITVTSKWLHRAATDAITSAAHSEFAEMCASEDLEHIEDADVLIAFSDTDTANPSKGGFHVELGYALGLGMPVLLIGPRLNVFHHLRNSVERYDSWAAALEWIDHVNA